MNAITKRDGRPGLLGREAGDRLNWLASQVEREGNRWQVPEQCAPSAAERAALALRADDLTQGLAPAARDEIVSAVSALLAGYPAGRAHKDDPKVVLAMFERALQGRARWALMQACADWNKEQKFAPTPAELRAAALELEQPARSELLLIRKVIDADVYRPVPEQERQRVAARFRELLADIESRTDAERRGPRDPWLDEVERMLREGQDDEAAALMRANREPVTLSPAVAASVRERAAS